MNFVLPTAAHPLVLLACLVAGILIGWIWPMAISITIPIAQAGMALLDMAAIPLIIVATSFGLRQTLVLPYRGLRLLMLLLLASTVLLGCAQLGAIVTHVMGIGLAIDAQTLKDIGILIQHAGGEAESTAMQLFNEQADIVSVSPYRWVWVDNFFSALEQGNLPTLLCGTIMFGTAFAVQKTTFSQALASHLEAIYRGLEIVILLINRGLPILVFCMAIQFSALIDKQTLHMMGGFLGLFITLVLMLSSMALMLVYRYGQATLPEVLSALKYPMLLSFASASPVAAIPATIDALSARLGFSRGMVDLLVPSSAVFLRVGSALYFSLLTVFVANLYGITLNARELMWVAFMASVAALASAGSSGLTSLGFSSMVVTSLRLPFEAVLPLFIAIDLLCEGPRNLLSVLACCVVVTLVCGGLPSERITTNKPTVSIGPVHFAFSKRTAIWSLIFIVAAILLSILMGIGVGLRQIKPQTKPNIVFNQAVQYAAERVL